MPAGKYRDIITVQRQAAGANDLGEPVGDWETYCTRRAHVATRGGREYWRAQQVQAETTHLLTLGRDRVTEAIVSSDRVVLGSATLEIVASYQADNQRREWVLECRETT